MKYLILVLLVLSCHRTADMRIEYNDCLEARMKEFGSTNGAKNITIEMLQQAQSACAPILKAKLDCNPPK